MLAVSNLSKSFGIETILSGINFTLNAGERLGLIGPNGSGKTTLLRILAGQDTPDGGSVRYDPPTLRIGYLPQGFEVPPAETVEGFLARQEGDLQALSKRLEELAAALAGIWSNSGYDSNRAGLGYAELQQEYDRVLARLEAVSEGAGRGPVLLAALGLADLPLDTPTGQLSGGQKTRLVLAGVLLSAPQLLLLDEPTNHLDLDMLAWLEDWLNRPPVSVDSGVLIVSHDRAFLDAAVTGILELDPHSHSLRAYAGNYSDYLEQKLAERERQWQAFSGQQEEINRLRRAAATVRSKAKFKRGGKADSGDKFAKGFFANRSLETMRRAKQLERRLERLLTEERVEKPRQSWQMKLEFEGAPQSGKDVLVLENLSVGYPEESRGAGERQREGPDRGGEKVRPSVERDNGELRGTKGNGGGSGGVELLKGLNLHVRQGARVAVVGPNGAGKTTLLRTVAGALSPLSGQVRLGTNVRLGYMAQEQEDLDPEIDAFTTLQKIAPLSETALRTFLHRFLFSGDEVFLPAGRLSFGERARLSLACLVARGCNLLLLDEPINHLDIPSRARFEAALAGFEGTVLAVVHDRYFIDGFATEIWEVEGMGIRRYETI